MDWMTQATRDALKAKVAVAAISDSWNCADASSAE